MLISSWTLDIGLEKTCAEISTFIDVFWEQHFSKNQHSNIQCKVFLGIKWYVIVIEKVVNLTPILLWIIIYVFARINLTENSVKEVNIYSFVHNAIYGQMAKVV